MAMAIDSFLTSFYAALCGLAGVDPATTPRSIWLHRAVEAYSTPVYTVARMYGQTPDPVGDLTRVPRISIQLDTRGPISDEPAVLAEAIRLNELLRVDATGQPRSRWTISSKLFDDGAIVPDSAGDWIVRAVLFSSGPALVASGDDGRAMASGNFDLTFNRA